MSLILDALRKSERSRQKTLSGQVSATDLTLPRSRIPVPWATLIGLVLVINAIALMIMAMHSHSASSTSTAAAPTPAHATAPAVPAYRPAIRSLAAEAAASSTTTPASVTSQSSISAPAVIPAPQPTSTILPATAIPEVSAPRLDSLPPAFQKALPALHLDVHSYSQDPTQRFVIINMQRYRIGDTLKEGPRVVNITRQGVILAFKGKTFLLPRP